VTANTGASKNLISVMGKSPSTNLFTTPDGYCPTKSLCLVVSSSKGYAITETPVDGKVFLTGPTDGSDADAINKGATVTIWCRSGVHGAITQNIVTYTQT